MKNKKIFDLSSKNFLSQILCRKWEIDKENTKTGHFLIESNFEFGELSI